MNIIEAMKSGKPFRRKAFNPNLFCYVAPISKVIKYERITDNWKKIKGGFAQMTEEDYLADDWELAE